MSLSPPTDLFEHGGTVCQNGDKSWCLRGMLIGRRFSAEDCCSLYKKFFNTRAVFYVSLLRGFQRHVSVPPLPYLRCPLQKYVRITFIRKNSVRTP